ncbi:carbon-nitrogen hydrolase [Hoyosella sp. G463]|uniref:Carbon-nitrogen hydrolase n=1 Tax=Lolliginicoccus lacisalsi TaxID=2742202 RepID=A0A927PMN1_9ACTN|nr:nitrilase-related carbon-nitrogen hydrolase [Lolliginicoccus lacisalsi]MBD8507049.1 carbon-nitrogen hydrolase [Lolliginicoccus lacisalsi]
MRVGIAQVAASALSAELDLNVAMLRSLAEQAARLHADILVTPELMLTRYEPAWAARHAAEGEWLREAAARISADAGVALVVSTPELADGRRFITVTLLAGGQALMHHRKRILFGAAEAASFEAGSEPTGVVELAGARIGLALCYEIEFPALARAAARAGADLMCVPTALTEGVTGQVSEQVPKVIVPARSIENQMHIAYANYARPEYIGQSTVTGPLGTLMRAGTEPVLAVHAIDIAAARAGRAINTYLQDLP